MKTHFYVLLFLLSLCYFNVYGQLENANWYFGNGAGLNFEGNVAALSNGQTTNLNHHTASISNEDGQLLFYTDGATVWNKNHQPMINGNGTLNGGGYTVSIVPMPGDCDKYYIFTVNNDYYYSIVDFNNNDMGEITNLNLALNILPYTNSDTQVVKNVNERPNHIAVAKHSDGESYWLILNPFDEIFTVLIDSSGVNSNLIVFDETVGTAYGNGTVGTNGIAVSNDSDKIAYGAYWEDYSTLFGYMAKVYTVRILDFNNATGEFSNFFDRTSNNWPETNTIYTPYRSFAFSQNGDFLYGLVVDDEVPSYIQQFELNALNILNYNGYNNQINIPISGQLENQVRISRGLNGDIYIPNGSNILNILNNSNQAFATTINQFDLGFGNATRNLPQLVQTQDNNNCDEEPCEANLQLTSNTIDCQDLIEGLEVSVCGTLCYGDNPGIIDIYLDIVQDGVTVSTFPASQATFNDDYTTFCFNNIGIDDFPNTPNGNYYFNITVQYLDSSIYTDEYLGVSFDSCEVDFLCDDIAVNVESFPDCNAIFSNNDNLACLSYTVPEGYEAAELILHFDQIDGNDDFDLIEFNPPVTQLDINNNGLGSFCFEITENLFQAPIQESYAINATLIVKNSNGECKVNLHRQPLLDFDRCNNCESITDIWITEDRLLQWNGNAPFYTLTIQEDPTCYGQSDGQTIPMTVSYQLEGNSFDLEEIYETLGRCVLFKIESDCDDTPWCMAHKRKRAGWFLPNGSCLDECPPLETYLNGNDFCWNDVAEVYNIEIIGDNTCSINDIGEITSFSFTTQENCIDLGHYVNIIRRKCFRVRVSYGDDCPITDCLISHGQNDFQFEGDCTNLTQNQFAQNNTASIYPNPASNALTIKSENQEISSLYLYNFYGKPIKTIKNVKGAQYQIDVASIAKGYYVLKVILKDGTIQHKTVILK